VPRSSHAPSSGATTRRRARAAADGSGRPGRLDPPDRHAALAAPRAADGFTSHWYRRGRLRLHLRQRHSGSEVPAVVLLHGLAVSHRYLMPTARALHRRRAFYVPDLPGFGLSDTRDEVLDVCGLRVSTLLAHGAHDRIAPQRWLFRAAALTPDARTLVIEGAAHNAVTTAGSQLAAAVDAFLGSRHEPSARPVAWLQKGSGG
jgi:pimeloyl-ACP methyl ester carboxylesterase